MEALPQSSRPRDHGAHSPSRSPNTSPSTSGHQHSKSNIYSTRPSPSPSSSASLENLAHGSGSSSLIAPSQPELRLVSDTQSQPTRRHHQPQSKSKSSGLLALAGRISPLHEPALRPRQSNSSLTRAILAADNGFGAPHSPSEPSPTYLGIANSGARIRRSSNHSTASGYFPNYKLEARRSSQSLVLHKDNPPSQPYSTTDRNQPPPVLLLNSESKMHQTSSRLLRMTDDDRPFTRDFKDLFSTLIVSLLPLTAHRVRLTKVEHTFLSEDAINNLGSLKFSQSNRMPDPKDPSRIVTTTTTTTFSMAKDMARAICQRFLEARFIESADGRLQQIYSPKGSVWQLTSKGITILDRFCARNGIQQKHVQDLIGNNGTQLVILERNFNTDKLVSDRTTIEVIFRRFIGTHGLNIKSSTSSADSDSLSDYRDGLTGVKMASERKVNGKTFKDTFTGKAACDWLMDCCTTVDRREPIEIAGLFVQFDLMETIVQDRAYMAQYPAATQFQPTKHSIYQLSSRGKEIFNGSSSRGRSSESEPAVQNRNAIPRDSNTQRLDKILSDPALRLLYRENLRDTHCEENLSFYVDVDEFVQGCRMAVRAAQKNPNSSSMDGIKEIMAQAYGIYNAFLAPGSPCELNIDHQLRNNLAMRMTKAVGQDNAMIDTLKEVTTLFEEAQNAVFKLMASDSVPKFLRNPKYEPTLKQYDFDAVAGVRAPERSLSRSNRS